MVIAGVALVSLEIAVVGRVSRLLGFARLVGRSEVEPGRFSSPMVQGGIYARVRHPRYTSAMAALFGIALLGGSWPLAAAAAASVPLYYVMTVMEERELVQRFGDEYLRYRARVPRFLPRR